MSSAVALTLAILSSRSLLRAPALISLAAGVRVSKARERQVRQGARLD